MKAAAIICWFTFCFLTTFAGKLSNVLTEDDISNNQQVILGREAPSARGTECNFLPYD